LGLCRKHYAQRPKKLLSPSFPVNLQNFVVGVAVVAALHNWVPRSVVLHSQTGVALYSSRMHQGIVVVLLHNLEICKQDSRHLVEPQGLGCFELHWASAQTNQVQPDVDQAVEERLADYQAGRRESWHHALAPEPLTLVERILTVVFLPVDPLVAMVMSVFSFG
jgi:hypothetical protein